MYCEIDVVLTLCCYCMFRAYIFVGLRTG